MSKYSSKTQYQNTDQKKKKERKKERKRKEQEREKKTYRKSLGSTGSTGGKVYLSYARTEMIHARHSFYTQGFSTILSSV